MNTRSSGLSKKTPIPRTAAKHVYEDEEETANHGMRTRSFYRNIVKEPEKETQDLEPALTRQKRKGAPSTTSEDNANEDESDAETITKASKKRRSQSHRSTTREDDTKDNGEFLMSGAIPNDEVIYEPVEENDDFIRSTAPSPSSIGAENHYRVNSDVVAPSQKARAFLSLYEEEEEEEDEGTLQLRLKETRLQLRLKKLQKHNDRSSSSVS